MSGNPEKDAFQRIVNHMTNHERNLWARAGYPGLRQNDIEKLTPYAGAAIRRMEGTYVTLAELGRQHGNSQG